MMKSNNFNNYNETTYLKMPLSNYYQTYIDDIKRGKKMMLTDPDIGSRFEKENIVKFIELDKEYTVSDVFTTFVGEIWIWFYEVPNQYFNGNYFKISEHALTINKNTWTFHTFRINKFLYKLNKKCCRSRLDY